MNHDLAGVGVPGTRAIGQTPATERAPEDDLRAAAGDGRTRQESLLLIVPIRKGEEARLEQLLADIAAPPGGEDLELNPILPFRRMQSIHFARILIHPPSPSDDSPLPAADGVVQVDGPAIPAKLLFSTDFDGTLEDHLAELTREAGPGLDRLFACCEGWPGQADGHAVAQFVERYRLRSNTFYTGTMNRSVSQIRREAELREEVDAYLDSHVGAPGFPTNPRQIRERVREWVFANPRFAWAKVPPGPYPAPLLPAAVAGHLFAWAGGAVLAAAVAAIWVLHTMMPLRAASVAVLVPLVLAGLIAFAGWRFLSFLAARDPVIIRDDVQEHTARLVQIEDRIVQNQMSSVIYVKRPLWFRGLVLRGVLAFINWSARYISNQGTLAGIPTIHFARWVIVDEGRRLLFFSNFDGSWENYLGDFIDKAHTGLTAVWSNCVGFPRTVGLTGQGATDEQRFKAYSRQSQVLTQVWYSAYRWLTVSNINDNTRFRLGLSDDMDADAAQEWLRMATPRQKLPAPPTQAPRAPRVETEDVQGLVARSYAPLQEAFYVPATLPANDAAAARAWLRDLIPQLTAASLSTADVAAKGRARNLAFTFAGLEALGLKSEEVRGFSREFKEGMAEEHRQRLLGDTGPADPAAWKWGGPANPSVHAMLFLFAGSEEALRALHQEEMARAARCGVVLAAPLDSIMLAGDKEHFGFHDGIAQPRIAGLANDGAAASPTSLIPAGEVVLGYPNVYNVLPLSPSVAESAAASRHLKPAPLDPLSEPRDLGRNGTYVVFRQLRQDVKTFWRYVDRMAGGNGERRKTIAAKMVGRWPNGAPLVKFPSGEPATFDKDTANDFLYRDDLPGDRCPIGSHIRRTNPRDGLLPNTRDSLTVTDRHRLLRRGRAYGPPLVASFDPDAILSAPDSGDRGLHFICFNTDLARQFEFVQNTWVNNMKFDGLYADPDPITAPHPDPSTARHDEEIASFTIQGCPVRQRTPALPQFVTMVGGAYLFMPGLNALRYLSAD